MRKLFLGVLLSSFLFVGLGLSLPTLGEYIYQEKIEKVEFKELAKNFGVAFAQSGAELETVIANDTPSPSPTAIPDEITNEEALKQALDLVKQLKGASPLMIAAIIVQIIFLVISTPISKILGGTWLTRRRKLLIILGLSVLVAVLKPVATGTPFINVILDAPTIAAIQVFLHQLLVKPNKVKA